MDDEKINRNKSMWEQCPPNVTPEELAQWREEANGDPDKDRREAFAAEAAARGLVYYPHTDTYADENANTLNAYGERI